MLVPGFCCDKARDVEAGHVKVGDGEAGRVENVYMLLKLKM